MPTIKFTDITGEIAETYYPVPAKQTIPEWLKNLAPYMDKDFRVTGANETNQTAKRCLPMLDAVMMGYTIRLTHDLVVTEENGAPYFTWPNGLGIDFHSPKQAPTHEAGQRGYAIPKWLNPWAIETPPGYSTMFIPPLNGDESVITPFSGVVDTDSYFAPVNFPFSLEKDFTGLIHAGTPIVQVIPFKRETWNMTVEHGRTDRIARLQSATRSVFRNAYRHAWWHRKDYS